MRSSGNCSSKLTRSLLALALALGGCAGRMPAPGTPVPVARVAVLPVDNLSGSAAPLKTIREELAARLLARGITVLPDKELDAFMTRHRLRYVGGVTRDDAVAFRQEAGVDAVAVTSLELYGESFPPRIALTTRLVSTGSDPKILAMESTALAGDDTPGLLGMGLIDKPQTLRAVAMDRLVAGLLAEGGRERTGPALRPASVFRNQPLDPGKGYNVAVLPFFNKSSRRYAGEIVALHFIRELVKAGRFSVLEPGVARQELLQYRIIMEDGVSLADAELVFGIMRVDLLFTGNVNDYDDIQGVIGAPKVDFTALMLNRDNRKAGWAVDTHARGDDRVYLFDLGRLSTANALAAAMTRGAVQTLVPPGTARQP